MIARISILLALFLASCGGDVHKGVEVDDENSHQQEETEDPDEETPVEEPPELCVELVPERLEFDLLEVGETSGAPVKLRNCGEAIVEVSAVAVDEEGAPFSADGVTSWIGPIQPGGELETTVTFEPRVAGEFSNWLVVELEGEQPRSVRLRGSATEPVEECVETSARIVHDGTTLEPGTPIEGRAFLELDGTPTEFDGGEITEYRWTIEGPGLATREETSEVASTWLTRMGDHVITLDVTTEDGAVACEPWSQTVTLEPWEGDLFVEVVWSNADDPEPFDDVGPDVDVHFLKMGPGRWFESPYDVYFRNPGGNGEEPLWGPEDPSLSTDDRGGSGPESILLPEGADCQWYAIGVHYYRELFGPAEVDVRIWVSGELVYESTDEPLAGGEFIDVAHVHWPSGTVYEVGERFEQAPVEVAPKVTDEMSSSGLCTDEMLY